MEYVRKNLSDFLPPKVSTLAPVVSGDSREPKSGQPAAEQAMRRREMTIDSEITLKVLAPICHQTDSEMQQRPQRTIRETNIIGVVIRLCQVYGSVSDIIGFNDVRRFRWCRVSPSAPTEPERSGPQRICQSNR